MTTIDQLQAFSFLPIKQRRLGNSKIGKMTLACSKRNRRIAFSAELSRELKAEKFCYLSVAFNNFTGDLAFVLSKNEIPGSLPLVTKKSNGKEYGLNICCKELWNVLVDKLGLSGEESFYAELSKDLSKNKETRFYIVNKIEE